VSSIGTTWQGRDISLITLDATGKAEPAQAVQIESEENVQLNNEGPG